MKIALTGGIACGKSLAVKYLNELGVATIDADDIVHELVPDEERKRLAKVVFNDPAARKALEARLHPLVKARIQERIDACAGELLVCVIPLLFEVHWDAEFDIICCVTSEKETQVVRMVTTRGYTREEAVARIQAQMPVDEKAAKSQYVIGNDGTPAELQVKVKEFVKWLRKESR